MNHQQEFTADGPISYFYHMNEYAPSKRRYGCETRSNGILSLRHRRKWYNTLGLEGLPTLEEMEILIQYPFTCEAYKHHHLRLSHLHAICINPYIDHYPDSSTSSAHSSFVQLILEWRAPIGTSIRSAQPPY
jgi:hypothetical protein